MILLSLAALVLGLVTALSVLPASFFRVVLVLLVLNTLPAFFGLITELGKAKGALVFFGVWFFVLGIEMIALRSGFPFGYFVYEQAAGPSLLNIVPLVVPFLWTPIILGAFTLATRLNVNDLKWIFTVGGIMVFIDLLLDPAAVAHEFWYFRNSGIFYDVPVGNFVGWLFSGSLIAFLVQKPIRSTLVLASFMLSIGFFTGIAFGQLLFVPLLIGLFIIGASVTLMTRGSSSATAGVHVHVG